MDQLLNEDDKVDTMPPAYMFDVVKERGIDPNYLLLYKHFDGDKSKDFYMGIIEATRVIGSFIKGLPLEVWEDVITDYGACAILIASKKNNIL